MKERRTKEKEDKAKGVQQSTINLPLPALPILTQPPPFNIASQQSQMTLQQQNHLGLQQTNQLALQAQDQINLSQNNQINLTQPQPFGIPAPGNLNITPTNMNLNMPPPNLAIPPPMNLGITQMNVLNPNQTMNGLQFPPQQGGIPYWAWGN